MESEMARTGQPALCDACGLPITREQTEGELVRVGSCEFPFRVHRACLAKMSPWFDVIAEWCQLTAGDAQSDAHVKSLVQALTEPTG